MDILKAWEEHQGLIHMVINQFDPQYHEDLLQEAYFVLLSCIRDHDESKYKFTTLLSHRLRWHCMGYVDNQRLVRLPAYMLSLKRKYNRYIENFQHDNGYSPTDSEIMEHLDINQETLSILKGVTVPSVSIEEMTDHFDGISVDTIGLTLEEIEKQQLEELWDLLPEYLSKRENEILVTKYKKGLEGNSLSDEMGICRQRCYSLEQSAINKLRRCTKVLELAEIYDIAPEGYYRGGFQRWKNTGSSCVEKMAMKNCK